MECPVLPTVAICCPCYSNLRTRLRCDYPAIKSKMNALCLKDLLSALRQLDLLLKYAVKNAQTANGGESALDPYRGLYINEDDLERDLVREPGVSLLFDNEVYLEEIFTQLVSSSSILTNLYQSFDLSLFDLVLVLIALPAFLTN